MYIWHSLPGTAPIQALGDENSQLHLLLYVTAAPQATQDYALEASFLRIITIPAIPAEL